jgi:hypothetical protein
MRNVSCWHNLTIFFIFRYGSWPASGEIDIMESRGNLDLTMDGKNIGVEQVIQTSFYRHIPRASDSQVVFKDMGHRAIDR